MQGRRRFWKGLGIAALVIIGLAALDYRLYPSLFPPGGRSFDRGQNAIWLDDGWYRGTSTEPVDQLAARLRAAGITEAYFHVRYIGKSGYLRFHCPVQARALVARMHQLAPGIRAIAWIYAGNRRGLTGLDLGDAGLRARMAGEARWLTTTCGFDGVQWDYEICANGDPGLPLLLQATRAAIPAGKTISVATGLWLPGGLARWGWSEAYFGQVAANCDELAVMGYDSGMTWPRAYVWLIRQECLRVTRAAAAGNPRCRVVIGLPTYRDGGPSHNPWAENLELGLKGVRESFGAEAPANFQGIALFSDSTTRASDWGNFQRFWRGHATVMPGMTSANP